MASMSATQMEMSIVELKEARATHRATQLRKKRHEYVRSLSVACKPDWLPKSMVQTTRSSQQRSRSTHGSNRVVTRTTLSNICNTKVNVDEMYMASNIGEYKMDAVIVKDAVLDNGEKSAPTFLHDHRLHAMMLKELDLDNGETTAPEDSASDSGCDSTKVTPKSTFQEENASLSQSLLHEALDLSAHDEAASTAPEEGASPECTQIAAGEQMAESDQEKMHPSCEASVETPATGIPQKEMEDFEKRKAIFNSVVAAQQQMLREAEKAAEAAQAEAGQARSELGKLAKKDLDRKQALQIEKQRSNELRRKRNQAAQIQAMMEKAERQQLEAKVLREQAEDEVLMSKARLLAEAEANAEAEAQARVMEAELRAQAEMEAKAKEAEALRARLLAEAEAAAQLAQQHAQEEALALKAKAEAEMKEQIKAEVEAAKSKADKEAQAVKEKALQDAIALKERAENQLKAKEAKAKEEAAAEAERRAQEAAAEAQRRAQRETALAIKQAKVLEQARSKEFKRKAQQEQELQKQRAKLEEEKAKVQAEAERIRAEAEKHARLCEEARIKVEREAEAKRAAAEAEAEKIKAQADSHAKALKVKIQTAKKELEASLRNEIAAEVTEATIAALDAEWTLEGRTEDEEKEFVGVWDTFV